MHVLLVLILLSCNDKSNNSSLSAEEYDYQLVKSDSIDLELAVDEYGKSYLDNFIKTEDTSLLYRKSRFENSVIVYDWNRKERIKKNYI